MALFIFLYQFHLLAADLSDAPLFIASVLGAFASAFVLKGLADASNAKRGTAYILVMLLIPPVVRLLIAFPRLLTGNTNMGAMILFDSLLLNYDRNAFITTGPFYWTAFTTFFSLRERRALRFSVMADCVLFVASFSIVGSVSIYTLPALRLIVFAAIVFFELAALMLSSPPEMRPQKKDYAAAGGVLLLLAAVCGALLVRPMQERALSQGGGLLQPKLFSFDFAPYIRLENEISMNDELIFIVRKNSRYEGETPASAEMPSTTDIDGGFDLETGHYDRPALKDTHYLMRRFVLSAYSTKEGKKDAVGFFRDDKADEETQSARLPQGRTEYNVTAVEARKMLRQEYYLVNIDSSAFIAMNEPAEVMPFENWDASSFKSAYAVNSAVSVCTPIDLIQAVTGAYNAETLEMTAEDYQYYTIFSGSKNRLTEREKKITALAEEITAGTDNYWEKIQYVYQYLKFGDYRYSLKPGIAPSGDQLDYFLFDSKKGYCSYFAFAFASLLRSIGIPSRVAVGFFLELDEGRLDFYPVRSNMAHAWAEVWFPGFGWIEYDPTTENLAEGEDFEFSAGTPEELFERLMKEIIDNQNRLKVKEGVGEEEGPGLAAAERAAAFVKKSLSLIAAAVIIAAFVAARFGYYIRCRFSKNPRKKTLWLWRHVKHRLSLAGIRRTGAEAESEWIDRIAAKYPDSPLRNIYDNVLAAKYAEHYGADQHLLFFALYKTFNIWHKIWRKKHFAKKISKTRPLVFIICIFLFSSTAKTYTEENAASPEEILIRAIDEEEGEFWERAIELYTTGKTVYPADYRFPLRLGDLYFSRRLYRLAMDEFLLANILLPGDTALLYRLSQAAGSLNENKTAAIFLERLLAIDPENREAIGSLGWMYFKLHRLKDGERLLVDAIERFGAEPDFCMTLGTIYSDMFNYPDAKERYMDAVSGALNMGAKEFASVAYYNLSILESRFYRYGDAFASTTSSLLMADRAGGHLARGELLMRRLDFGETFNEYNKSYEIDKSPLSKLSLAQAFLKSGDLTQARLYAEDCLSSDNFYWMLNYGIDPGEYKRDIHEILYKAYSGLGKKEALTSYYGFFETARGMIMRTVFYFKYRAHKLLYQKYSLLSAGAFETEPGGRHLEALFEYYNAFYDYKGRAIYYLRAARDFELRLIPESAPSYLFETGKFLRNEAMLQDAIATLAPVWEKDLAADTYVELALTARHELAAEAAGRLFALNPGALWQNGIRFPVDVQISGGENIPARRIESLIKTLNSAGFDTKPAAVRWTLRLRIDAGAVYAELYDGGTGIVTRRKTLPLPSFRAKHLSAFANALADELASNVD
jgi:hypothetical protein